MNFLVKEQYMWYKIINNNKTLYTSINEITKEEK